ncbi:MAG: hypothetical protein AAF724_16835 [Pseudomonadota bacterium]
MLSIRPLLNFFHKVSEGGLIGGLACYMILLAYVPHDTPAAYANLRQSIAAISNYVLIPSLAVALVSGLFLIAAHPPFMNKGWVWIKALIGFVLFKAVLALVAARADEAALVSERLANGEQVQGLLNSAIANEWMTLWLVMTLSVLSAALGSWRPRLKRRVRPASQSGAEVRSLEDADLPGKKAA